MLALFCYWYAVVAVFAYKFPNITFPLDSGIHLLRSSDVVTGKQSIARCHDPGGCAEESATCPVAFRRKKINLNWSRRSIGDATSLPLHLEIPNTVVVQTVDNVVSFPVLSIDYGSQFVGLSLHHMGKSESLRVIQNTGDVEQLCGSIYTVIRERVHPPTRYLLLVGFPFSRDQATEGKCLFQVLYNLDFATRLSRYIYRRHLESYGNFEHVLNSSGATVGRALETTGECISCALELGFCPYNDECGETFKFSSSDYGSAAVIGISEELTSYQTEIFKPENHQRRDSLASDLIFRNLVEAMCTRKVHRMPFLILPSNNNIFRSHAKGECLLLYKAITAKISASMK